MDFEEQLEKAERLESPSLVGSSLRSADDSAHQNYIHPEKYKGKKSTPGKHSFSNSSIGASLDDLISEGALLGSEEDFDRFLDDKGNVKNDAKYLSKSSTSGPSNRTALSAKSTSPLALSVQQQDDMPGSAVLSPVDSEDAPGFSDHHVSGNAAGHSLYAADNYSAPNLSEYQLEHQISDHSELMDLVKSYDLSRLPSSSDRELAKSNINYAASERIPKSVKVAAAKRDPLFSVELDGARIAKSDSLHTPYFPRDERSPSRSRSARVPAADSRSRSTSRSRSVNKPHLARGDSYKSTHDDAPTKYELPAGMAVEENAYGNDRRSRQSRPTMGDSIAAAEAQEVRDYYSENITRDPSLVTTGDYTNFDCDIPSERMDQLNMYSVRSQSSTNYLRSISRSRSRQPQRKHSRDPTFMNEKNDANPEELAREGALVSDDPYGQLTGMDAMVDKVLKNPSGVEFKSSKKSVNDVSAEEKDTETKEQLIAEEAPTISAKDIKVNEEIVEEASKSSEYVEEVEAETKEDIEDTQDVADVPAEVKVEEAHEQLVAEEAPLVTAKDIKMDEVKKSEFGDTKGEESIDKESIDKADEGYAATSKHFESKILDSLKALEAKDKLDGPGISEAAEPTEDTESTETKAEVLKLTEPELESNDPKKAVSEDEQSAITDDDAQKVPDSVVQEVRETKAETEDSSEEPKVDVEDTVDVTPASAKVESVTTEDFPKATDEIDEEELPLNVKSAPKTDLADNANQETDGRKTEDNEVPSEVETASQSKVEAVAKEPETPVEEVVTSAKSPDESEAETKAKEPEAPTIADAAPVEDEDFDVSPEELRKHLQSLPIYLFTSLAGGMQIIQKTNRLATILQGNGIKFEYRDLGTDEEAKKLWRRYAQGKTLPGVFRDDDFIGNWQYVDEVNEDYRLHEVLYEAL